MRENESHPPLRQRFRVVRIRIGKSQQRFLVAHDELIRLRVPLRIAANRLGEISRMRRLRRNVFPLFPSRFYTVKLLLKNAPNQRLVLRIFRTIIRHLVNEKQRQNFNAERLQILLTGDMRLNRRRDLRAKQLLLVRLAVRFPLCQNDIFLTGAAKHCARRIVVNGGQVIIIIKRQAAFLPQAVNLPHRDPFAPAPVINLHSRRRNRPLQIQRHKAERRRIFLSAFHAAYFQALHQPGPIRLHRTQPMNHRVTFPMRRAVAQCKKRMQPRQRLLRFFRLHILRLVQYQYRTTRLNHMQRRLPHQALG